MTGYLAIYDAKDLKQLCLISLPQRIPLGFHGLWMSNKEVKEERAARKRSKEKSN